MKTIFVLLIIPLIWSFNGYCQKKQAIITYPNETAIILNANANLDQTLKKEIGPNGIRIKKMTLFIDRPSHLYHINTHNNGNSFSYSNYSTIVLPGDSVTFSDEKTVKYSPFNNQMIDSLLLMDLAYGVFISEAKKKQSAKQQLLMQIEGIEATYQQNNKRIGLLKMADTLKGILADFNYILKCKTIIDLKTDNLTLVENRMIDSLYKGIEANYSSLEKINSPFVREIYRGLLKKHLKSIGVSEGKIWENLNKFSELPFFKNYLALSLYGANQSGSKQREELFAAIKAANLADLELTTVYFKLKNKKPVLENLPILNLEKVRLSDRIGKELSLATILARNKGKIVLIDFWASWCVPCRDELPKFVKYRNKLKNSPIAFVNFSIDLDSKIADWKKALVEEKELNNPNQFRMIDWKNSELTKLIDLRSIPRYLIIDDKGKILNSEFLKPSSASFEEELKKYVSTVPKK